MFHKFHQTYYIALLILHAISKPFHGISTYSQCRQILVLQDCNGCKRPSRELSRINL